MPRSLAKSKVEDFEPKKRNPLGLLDDSNLDSHLKSLKIGNINSPIEMSKTEIRFNSDVSTSGKFTTPIVTESELIIEARNFDSYGQLSVNNEDSIFVTTLESVNSEGATGHIELKPEATTFFRGKTSFETGKNHYLNTATTEGSFTLGDSYFNHDSLEQLKFTINSTDMFRLSQSGGSVDVLNSHLDVPATKKVFLDGGTHTYITESSADVLDIYVGGDKMLSLDESVDTGVTSLVGTLKIAEQADASADTGGYGQLWVDTATPNELAFTDDAGTDIIGIGKYHYESKVCNHASAATGNFIPLAGYVIERTSTAGQNEYIAMVAPYNGVVEKILWRSEESQDGLLTIEIYESADETEVPGSVTGQKATTLDRINDDISVDVSFASMTSGVNTLLKGRIYAIKITSPSAPGDTNVTVVFKWDITS